MPREGDLVQQTKPALLFDEDEVFIQAATNPVRLSSIRLLLGQSARQPYHLILLKPPTDHVFDLHTDNLAEYIPMGGGVAVA